MFKSSRYRHDSRVRVGIHTAQLRLKTSCASHTGLVKEGDGFRFC